MRLRRRRQPQFVRACRGSDLPTVAGGSPACPADQGHPPHCSNPQLAHAVLEMLKSSLQLRTMPIPAPRAVVRRRRGRDRDQASSVARHRPGGSPLDPRWEQCQVLPTSKQSYLDEEAVIDRLDQIKKAAAGAIDLFGILAVERCDEARKRVADGRAVVSEPLDRKSTRLNSSH